MTDSEIPRLKTQIAASGYDEHLFRQYKVFAQLAGNATLTELIALGVSGRRLSQDELGVLDDLATAWTIADPRIWPLKVARLAASFGSTLQGVGAGMLAMDCRFVGVYRTSPAAARLLLDLEARAGPRPDHDTLEAYFAGQRYLAGYGVPFRETDERLAPFRRGLEQRGKRERLPWFALFEHVGTWARRERRMPPNIAGAAAAAMLDMGLSVDEIGAVTTALSVHMFFANAFEGAKQQAEVLQQLPASSLNYQGPVSRRSPRAIASARGR